MSLVDPALMQILRCPVCKGTLTEHEAASELACANDHRYPVTDGVPDMVPAGEDA